MNQLLCRAAAHFSEFTAGFNGTCTQTALAICMGISDNKAATQEDMVRITDDMIGKKLCAQNGAATIAAVAQEARAMGFPVELEWDFGQMGDWHGKLKDYAGKLPILLQVANGQALKDVETGKADESGVHYHAIAVVGFQDDGYVVADGDNPEVNQRYQVYPYDVLQAAQPCGLLILGLKVPLVPDLPSGATDDGTTLAWAGFEIKNGFRQWQFDNQFKMGVPLGNAWMENNGESFQTFALGELRHTEKDGVFVANVGADLVLLRSQVASLSKVLEKVRADLA